MDETPHTSDAIVCATCEGDTRRSASCSACHGAGVGVPSHDGFLVWSEPVDAFTIALRKAARTINLFFHLSLSAFVVGTIVFCVWRVGTTEDLSELATAAYWTSGQTPVTWLWLGLLVGCFLIFRISEYTHEARSLPNWGAIRSPSVKKNPTNTKTSYRFEIEPYFSPSARDTIEDAYRIAASLKRTEITPQTLFAAALASSIGGFFMVRLGMSFDSVKMAIARVLSLDPGGNPPIALSRDVKRTLALAYADACAHGRKHVSPIELFLQSFMDSPKIQEALDQLGFPPDHVRRVAEWIRLEDHLREDHERFTLLARLKPKTAMNRAMTARQTRLLDRHSEDLTALARFGYLSPIVGREHEVTELLRAIESGRRSVALVGEPGVGKMGIVEHLARRMAEEDVPPELFDRRLVSVNLAQVIAAGDPALASERFVTILNEVGLSGNVILVLQGIESLTGAGSGGPMDLAEIFSTELDKGYFIAIVTTTPRAWAQYLERRSLGAQLVKIDVPELGVADTIAALMARCGAIEARQRVFFSYAALDRAAKLADRYIHDTAAPEKAFHVLREAAVAARGARGEKTIVTAEDVARIVHEKTKIPVEALTRLETEKLLHLEGRLHGRIVGQNEAVTAISQALRRARVELREGKRPIANFLFLGPTGVGKTELAKAIASEYFGSEDAMVRMDMSEYQDAASIARLIGTAGDERGGLLTEAVRQTPFAIVLLDELEKAHPDILNLFLQVMDDGRLTDGVGRTVDFTNTMVIATSNAGTQFIQDAIATGRALDEIKTGLLERELTGTFRPEFLNRFDGVIVFRPLTMDDVTQIAWLFVNGIAKRLEEKGINFTAEDAAVEELAHAGYDPLFGARPLRRVMQERVDNGLANLLLQNKIGRKDTVVLETGGNLRVEKALM